MPEPSRADRWRKRVAAAALLASLAAVGLAAYPMLAQRAAPASPPGAPTATASAPRATAQPRPDGDSYSNIYKYDYVGPEACRKCHEDMYDLWREHPHSRMNQPATGETVVGDFSGAVLEYGDGKVEFARIGGELTMSLYRDGAFVRRLKVTRTVGSRFIQMYIGLQVDGPEPADDRVYHEEGKLPFAYWIEREQWFPQTYDETPPFSEYDEAGKLRPFYAFYEKRKAGTWQKSCILCHNTYPYARRLDPVGQGKVTGFPNEDLTLARHEEPNVDRTSLGQHELVTMGVSCESCHFGGREHAIEGKRISFVPRSDDLTFAKATPELIEEARASPYVINSICAQCHAAETQGVTYPHGGSSWNSGEAKDIAASSCRSEIRCTHCHNPHEAGPVPGGGPDKKTHLDACIGCHTELAPAEAASAHARHEPATASCLDCHMPRIVHGLSGMIRSHRISSPADASMIAGGWPNACNLCHLDQSLKWTIDALEAGWGAKVELESAFVPPGGPAGEVWLGSSEPIVRQVAADAYSRSPLGKAALPGVLRILMDESPPNRMFGVLAAERILGREIDAETFAPWASPAVREAQIKALLGEE